MDDRLKVVSVMDDEELFNLIGQVRNLCQNLNGNSSSSQKSNVENGTKANTKNKIKTPENKTPPPPTNQKKNELSIDEPVEIAKEAGNTPPKPDDQSVTTPANENEQNDSPYGPIIISEKSRNLGPKNEMTELFFFKNRR
uniref:Uncharacterized protein n=1 Tax=Romanomermis culicivorax TaxID=13658 RepID=A0A915JRH6_ROMCU